MTSSRQWEGKLDVVAALGILATVLTALYVGYLVGRRAGQKAPTWSRRTSRAALSRQAIGLIALVAASRLQRTIRRKVPAISARRLPWPMWR